MVRREKQKRLGQNFLINQRAAQTIIEKFHPKEKELIVEIGPGKGALTDLLVKSKASIMAIEVDPALCKQLRQKFEKYYNLRIITGDILNYHFSDLLTGNAGKINDIRVIGNIPYHISKPILMKLIAERDMVHDAILMLQREVAERVLASPGSKNYSPLSVLFALTAATKKLMTLSPGSFSPPPQVYSTLISCTFLKRAKFREEEVLKTILAALFSKRRKTIKNNLATLLKVSGAKAASLIESCGYQPMKRAEELDPEDFLKIASFLHINSSPFDIIV